LVRLFGLRLKYYWPNRNRATIANVLSLLLFPVRSKGRGGASGCTRPAAQALGAHHHTFCSHLKRILSRNLDQSMPKIAYFLEKDVKNRFSVGGSASEPPSHLKNFCSYFWFQTL